MSVFQREADDGVTRGTRALIVHADQMRGDRNIDARLEEAIGLAAAIGIDVQASHSFRVRAARPSTLFGKGQVEKISDLVEENEAELVVVDNSLTPVQQSNLEKATNAKVIDRTGLILEIFGERAATAEGRLQVELAHLDYQAGRLVRSWTHLERQRGGFGFLGGPGETQIEADRRMIRDRMAKLRRELDQVSRTRGLHRDRRKRAPWPIIALVGYTNAGKSTLFNRLTGADVVAEDLLFATLDPTLRQISLPGVEKAILSDTVGFVSDLPTQLIAAFRATLEEVIAADLIVHVRDISHPDSEAQRGDVLAVLDELGVTGDDPSPMIEAWNKIDLLPLDEAQRVQELAARREDVKVISAVNGEGIVAFQRLMSQRLSKDAQIRSVLLPGDDGASLAWLHANGEVLESKSDEDRLRVSVRMSDADYARFLARQNG